MFRRIPGRLSVGKVSPATSRVHFRSAECVPPHPGSISGQQNVFRRVPGQFPVGRVCSAASRIDFRSAEGVPPRPRSFSGQQSVFCHVPVHPDITGHEDCMTNHTATPHSSLALLGSLSVPGNTGCLILKCQKVNQF